MRLIERFQKNGVSPKKLAWSATVGTYLAFSPFLGIQTFLVFILAFVLRANTGVVFTTLYTINNPWTMIPIAIFDYAFGAWFVHTVLALDLSPFNPAWMIWLNSKIGPYLAPYLGTKTLCLWCFLIGGNIIALVIATASYPFFKKLALKGYAYVDQKRNDDGFCPL